LLKFQKKKKKLARASKLYKYRAFTVRLLTIHSNSAANVDYHPLKLRARPPGDEEHGIGGVAEKGS